MRPWARKYGIPICIDLPVPPGGRDETKDLAMYYDKTYAAHFVTCWRRIATRILYVSCDPATLTRDLATLTRTYDISRVKLFDLFPRTARFETLVTLERKQKS